MNKDPHSDIFTVGIGGAAGDGVKEASLNLGLILKDLGYEVYTSFTYPSLIRGGHNFGRLSFAKEKVWNDHGKLDVLIALNDETVRLHRDELNKNAVVFADNFEGDAAKELGAHAVAVPMSESAKSINASPITRNSVALGGLCYLLDLPLSEMTDILHIVFARKELEANIKLAEIGYKLLEQKQFRHTKKIHPGELRKELLDGNTAFGKGLMAAGLDIYVSYPMTPSSGILHYLAGEQKPSGNLKVIQPENEISAIGMTLGAAYAGKRAATGTAGGGFALMQEFFSMAGGAEIPSVIAVSQRQAPATGQPTATSQSDLRFVLHAGHGEFPRIVIAPGDSEEAFYAGADALNLAWKFQLPVIVLLDKVLSEHSMTAAIDPGSVVVERGKVSEKVDGTYGRYLVTPDGISPMAFPGTPNTIVKVTSYEHDENGITADSPAAIKKMADKRFAKISAIEEDMKGRETVKVFGQDSDTAIVFYGSTKGPVLEAAKYLDKPAKLVQILWLSPFPTERLHKELRGQKKVICVELNHEGALASLIREKTGVAVDDKILKYDSTPFDPVELAEQINKKVISG